MVVTMGDLLWSGGVDAGCRGGFRAGARLRVPQDLRAGSGTLGGNDPRQATEARR